MRSSTTDCAGNSRSLPYRWQGGIQFRGVGMVEPVLGEREEVPVVEYAAAATFRPSGENRVTPSPSSGRSPRSLPDGTSHKRNTPFSSRVVTARLPLTILLHLRPFSGSMPGSEFVGQSVEEHVPTVAGLGHFDLLTEPVYKAASISLSRFKARTERLAAADSWISSSRGASA